MTERIAELCAEWKRLLTDAAVAGDGMPWCWEMTGEKGNDWLAGVAVTPRDDAVIGELRDPEGECIRIHTLFGSESDGEYFGVPRLICWMRNHAEEIIAALESQLSPKASEKLKALPRYNCDCLPSGPDGITPSDDPGSLYTERDVLLASDVDAALSSPPSAPAGAAPWGWCEHGRSAVECPEPHPMMMPSPPAGRVIACASCHKRPSVDPSVVLQRVNVKGIPGVFLCQWCLPDSPQASDR